MDAKDVKYIVIHCSDTTPNMDIGAKEIDLWHKQNGWDGIGYHLVIRRNGTVEPGRPLDRALTPGWQLHPGAHVAGYNSVSIGVCIVGGGGRDRPNFTSAQWASLAIVTNFLTLCFPAAKILGHRDLDPHKDCPCFDVAKWLKET